MPIPNTLSAITRELIAIRKKPGTQERFKSYPALLLRFKELLEVCVDSMTLREVIELDSGYHLLAGYRQQVLERWLLLERTPENLRLYAHQLMLFGNVDEWGEAELNTDERVQTLLAEADALESSS